MDCLFRTTNELAEYLDGSFFEDMYQFPEFVRAIVGISHDSRLVYSYTKLIQLIIEDSEGEIDEEGAIEHIEYNVIRTADYLGPHAPIIMYDDFHVL